MSAALRQFLEERMYELHLQESPHLRADDNAAHLLRKNLQSGDAKLRFHNDIYSLQHGTGVVYAFPLEQPNMYHKYEEMVVEAARGILHSIDLLIGFKERHKKNGVEGNIAYLTTVAEPPVPRETESDDSYDPLPDADDFG